LTPRATNTPTPVSTNTLTPSVNEYVDAEGNEYTDADSNEFVDADGLFDAPRIETVTEASGLCLVRKPEACATGRRLAPRPCVVSGRMGYGR